MWSSESSWDSNVAENLSGWKRHKLYLIYFKNGGSGLVFQSRISNFDLGFLVRRASDILFWSHFSIPITVFSWWKSCLHFILLLNFCSLEAYMDAKGTVWGLNLEFRQKAFFFTSQIVLFTKGSMQHKISIETVLFMMENYLMFSVDMGLDYSNVWTIVRLWILQWGLSA